jgi:hypothetical protein
LTTKFGFNDSRRKKLLFPSSTFSEETNLIETSKKKNLAKNKKKQLKEEEEFNLDKIQRQHLFRGRDRRNCGQYRGKMSTITPT